MHTQFWETEVHAELMERDRKENSDVVRYRHLNKAALCYRIHAGAPCANAKQRLKVPFLPLETSLMGTR